MSDDAGAYLLLAVDLLVVAAVLTLLLLGVWWLVGKPRDDPSETALRRCDGCGLGWKGQPGDDTSVLAIKVRRRKRRSSRAKQQDTPAWARRRGWSVCPSCLSTKVRTSRRGTS